MINLQDQMLFRATFGRAALWPIQERLFQAAQEGNVRTLQRILAAHPHAHVNFSAQSGSTPLQISAYKGYLHCVRWLVEHANADIHQPTSDSYHITPLYAAAQEGHTDVVDYLLAHGAGASAQNWYTGYTPLHISALQGHTDTVKLLAQRIGSIRLQQSGEGQKAFLLALSKQHYGVMECLIGDHGISVDVHFANGLTPLCSAVVKGQLPLVRFLCHMGASINLSAHEGTGLQQYNNNLQRQESHASWVSAVSSWNEAVCLTACRLLLGSSSTSTTSSTSFRVLSSGNGGRINPRTTSVVYTRCPSITTNDSRGGLTALQLALRQGDSAIVRTLLEWGADPFCQLAKPPQLAEKPAAWRLPSLWSRSPLTITSSSCSKAATLVTTRVVPSQQEAVSEPLLTAIAQQSMQSVQALVERGVLAHSSELQKRTILNFASQCGHGPLFQYLCEQFPMDDHWNALLVSPGRGSEETPLSIASRLNHSDIAFYLVRQSFMMNNHHQHNQSTANNP